MPTRSIHTAAIRFPVALAMLLQLAAFPATAYVVPCPDDGIPCTADFVDPQTQQCVHPCVPHGRCETCDGGRCLSTANACKCTRAYVCPEKGVNLRTPDGRIVFASGWGLAPPMKLRVGQSPPEGAVTTFHMLIVERGPYPKVAFMSPQASTPYWTAAPGGAITLGAAQVGPAETFVPRPGQQPYDAPTFLLEAPDGSFVGAEGDALRTGFPVEGATRFFAPCAPW